MVVVPAPSPVVTGFGDALIVAAEAAGLAACAFGSGFFDGPHAAKKNSGRSIAIIGMSRFIRIVRYHVSRMVSFVNSFGLARLRHVVSEINPQSAVELMTV